MGVVDTFTVAPERLLSLAVLSMEPLPTVAPTDKGCLQIFGCVVVIVVTVEQTQSNQMYSCSMVKQLHEAKTGFSAVLKSRLQTPHGISRIQGYEISVHTNRPHPVEPFMGQGLVKRLLGLVRLSFGFHAPCRSGASGSSS